jgi:hypothetical protein
LTPNNDATAAPIIPVLEAAGAIIVEDTNFTGVSCPHLMQFILTIAIFTFPFFQTFDRSSEVAGSTDSISVISLAM